MSRYQQLYDPAQAITGQANGADLADNVFVKVASAKANGAAVPVSAAGASDDTIGAVCKGATQNGLIPVYSGGVQDVVASGSIAAGVGVQLAANGAVATYSSGRKVGVSLAASANGLVLIQIQL